MHKSQFFGSIVLIAILLVLLTPYTGFCVEAESSYQGLNIGGEQAQNPFQSDGVSSDDVNTFTGNVELDMQLVSLPGPNGFNLELGIEYCSEIEEMVYQNNDRTQSSWLGVGWNLEMPAIVADLNGTVDYNDDKYFYNSPGEGMIPLIPIVTDPEQDEYMLERFQPWKIKRIFGQEQNNVQYVISWEITREDGSMLIFGDNIDPNIPNPLGFDFDATRIALGLENSILAIKTNVDETVISEIRHVSYQWDLKTVKSVDHQNSITICYGQQTKLGYSEGASVNEYFTRCSHPDTIIDAIGRSVVFYTGIRLPGEYYNKMPHSNFARHDSVYLDSLVMFGCDGDWLGKYDFSYALSNVYEEYPYDLKRYLTGISYYAYNDSTVPTLRLDYYLDQEHAPVAGLFKGSDNNGPSTEDYEMHVMNNLIDYDIFTQDYLLPNAIKNSFGLDLGIAKTVDRIKIYDNAGTGTAGTDHEVTILYGGNNSDWTVLETLDQSSIDRIDDCYWMIPLTTPTSARFWRVYIDGQLKVDDLPVYFTEIKAYDEDPVEDHPYFGALRSIRYPGGSKVEYGYAKKSLEYAPIDTNVTVLLEDSSDPFIREQSSEYFIAQRRVSNAHLTVHYWDGYWRQITFNNVEHYACAGNSFVFTSNDPQDFTVHIYEIRNGKLENTNNFECGVPNSPRRSGTEIWAGQDCYYLRVTPENTAVYPIAAHFLVKHNGQWLKETNNSFHLGLCVPCDNTSHRDSVFVGKDYFVIENNLKDWEANPPHGEWQCERRIYAWKWNGVPGSGGTVQHLYTGNNMDMNFYFIPSDDYFVISMGSDDYYACEHSGDPNSGHWRQDWTQTIYLYLWDTVSERWNEHEVGYVEDFMREGNWHQFHPGSGWIWLTAQRDFFAYAVDNRPWRDDHQDGCFCRIVKINRNEDGSNGSGPTDRTIAIQELDWGNKINVTSGPDYVAIIDNPRGELKIWEWNGNSWSSTEIPLAVDPHLDDYVYMWPSGDHFFYAIPKQPEWLTYKVFCAFEKNIAGEESEWHTAFVEEFVIPEPDDERDLYFYGSNNRYSYDRNGSFHHGYSTSKFGEGRIVKGYKFDNPNESEDDDRNFDLYTFNQTGQSFGLDIDTYTYTNDVYSAISNKEYDDGDLVESTYDILSRYYDFDFDCQWECGNVQDYPCISKTVYSIDDNDITGTTWYYDYFDGTCDASTQRAKYHKSVVELPGDGANGSVENYYYCGLSRTVFTDNLELPDLTEEELGLGFLLNGVPYKTYIKNAVGAIIDSSFNYYKCKVPVHIDVGNYPTIIQTYLDSTFTWTDTVEIWTKYDYNSFNDQAYKIQQFYRPDYCKTTEIHYAYSQYSEMYDRNMLTQPYQVDVIDEDLTDPENPIRVTLRSSKTEWEEFSTPASCIYPAREYGLLDGDWALQREIIEYDSRGNIINELDALGVEITYLYDDAGIFNTASFVNADPLYVMYPPLVNYCAGDGSMLHDGVYTSEGINVIWIDNPGKIPESNSWEDEYGYTDPREDGIEIFGNAGDYIEICHPDADIMPFEGDYILRFDYRIKSGGINAVAGIDEVDPPINWYSSAFDENGLWHVAFIEGTWYEGSQDKLCIKIICDEDLTQYMLDNLAFYPVSCLAATKKVNYDKGKVIAETDDNGFSTRFVYDLYNQPIAVTDQYRENITSTDVFYMFESESIGDFEEFENFPNFTSSSTYPNRNLLINSGFEHGKFGWSVNEDEQYFRTELYHDSDNCGLCDNPVMGSKLMIIDPPTSMAAESYSFSQKTRTGIIRGDTDYTLSLNAWDHNGPSNAIITLFVDWHDRMGGRISTEDEHLTLGSEPTMCLKCQFTFTSPPNAVSAEITIDVASPTGAYVDAYYFDQIEFIKASEYVPSLVDITYSDGQGKNLQNVSTYNTLDAPDFVSAKSYDEFFRIQKEYKPYEVVQVGHRYDPNFDSNADTYYSENGPDDHIPDCGGVPYKKYQYMANPKGRLEAVYVPGVDFIDKPTTLRFGTNIAPINGYEAKTLSKSITIDPGDLVSVEYKNIFGHTIETTADSVQGGLNLTTRYEVNIAGDVTKVTPPLASELQDQNDLNYSDLEITNAYDTFGRQLRESSSDYGLSKYIYDAAGQLRFYQNSKQKEKLDWTEIVYDVLGREILRGRISQATDPDPELEYLSWSESGEVLRCLYDSYSLSLYEQPRKLSTPTVTDFMLDTLRVRGKLIVSDNGKNNPGTDVRKFYTYGNNGELLCEATFIEGLDSENKEVYSEYDISGRKIRQEYPENVGEDTPLLEMEFGFDERSRLETIDKYEGGVFDHRLASYKYFIDGAVKRCILGDDLQKIDYFYNAPGWLTEINGIEIGNQGLDPDPDDKFKMRLGYHQGYRITDDDPIQSFPVKFNGTPTWAVYHYHTATSDDTLGNTFYYDAANRLIEAKFAKKDNEAHWNFIDIKDGMRFEYDANSNIRTQMRYFSGDADYTVMSYNYGSSPYTNRLKYISPIQSDYNYKYDPTGNCMRDTFRGNAQYFYNWRNMMMGSRWDSAIETEYSNLEFTYGPTDNRVKKVLSDIQCDENYLSLVTKKPFQTCIHDDDCAGLDCCPFLPGDMNGDGLFNSTDVTKLVSFLGGTGSLPDTAMRMDTNCDGLIDGTDVTTMMNYFKGTGTVMCCYWIEPDTTSTYYVHDTGVEATEFYKGGESVDNVCYVYGPNGRIASFNDGEGPFYYLADHLGTTRMVLDKKGKVAADLYYLPFGDASPNYPNNFSIPEVTFRFSGKELDDERVDDIIGFNLYYFGARYYDPLSCQWKQVDPKAYKYPSLSPYNYCANSPVLKYDPDGQDFDDFIVEFNNVAFQIGPTINNVAFEIGPFFTDFGYEFSDKATSRAMGIANLTVGLATEPRQTVFNISAGLKYTVTHPDDILRQYITDISNKWESGAYGSVFGSVGYDILEAGAFSRYASAMSSLSKPLSLPTTLSRTRSFTTPPINTGSQGKHIKGHNNFNFRKGRSILTANPYDLAHKAGTGEPVGNKLRGMAGFKERVDFGYKIGYYVNKKGGPPMETTRGIIHYNQDGLIHIVPARPRPR
ncbi:MAG: hypothetical protein GY839_12510 [candidate division Zixibacteria bacterium]|nr:hypothetical protein [candidate division Zixibacteria bacterium]